jgi:uncharacterized membrane protein
MRNAQLAAIGIVLLSFIIAFYCYPQMPEKMASHWDAQGNVNGYMSKLEGVFLMPIISIILVAFLFVLPLIDPLKANIEQFRGHYENFVALLTVFMLYIYLLTLAWNQGMTFGMTSALAPAFGVLFFYTGIMLEHAKQNWFMGIRTPWTMSSESVWDKTHKIGAKLFKAGGIIAIFGALLPDYGILLIIVPVIGAAVYLTIYSYLEYKKEQREKEISGKEKK